MVAWIVYFKDNAVYNQKYIQLYIEEGNKLGIDVKLILVEELSFGVKDNLWYIQYQGGEIPQPAFVICRAIHPLLTKQLELMGIRVFNNSLVSEICNDKARTYQYLAKTGIPMVDTLFYRNSQLQEVLRTGKRPFVIKTVDGHGGRQVFLMPADMADSVVGEDFVNGDPSEINARLQTIREGIGSSDFVVQPLIGSRYQDLRVYVIGNEIIAGVLRTAKDGFKSNFSLGGDVCLYELKEEEKAIVHKIMEQFDFDLVGIDFIIGDQGELIFNEIEDVVGARMLYQCSDINIVELYLKYILQKMNKTTTPKLKSR